MLTTSTTRRPPDRKPRLPLPTAVLLTISQAALLSGVPATSLRDLIHRGHLPVVVLPGSRRLWLRRSDLEQLIERSVERVS